MKNAIHERKTYTLNVYNHASGQVETVEVTEEVYRTYRRTEWNIADNDSSFYAHEIQFSSLIGGNENAFHNFREFIDTENTPDLIVEERLLHEHLTRAMSSLSKIEKKLIYAIYFEGLSEREYAQRCGTSQPAIHKMKHPVHPKRRLIMIAGCLQKKNGYYYAVLYTYVGEDKKTRKNKWIPLKLPVEGTSPRKAQKAFDEARINYEKELEEQLAEQEMRKQYHPDALLSYTVFLDKWLQATRASLATTTYQSYKNLISARVKKYFDPMDLMFHQVNARHIEDFYQSIFADGCNANTVIHYHSILNKSFKYAMKKKILTCNPMDEVERPKKNQYRATFYSVEEMMTLMDAFSDDPLVLPVQVAAYYGLRRSEVLGLKWDAIDFKNNAISIRHKVVEVEVDGKFVPVGEDVLKTKSSFRTLPLIPEVKNLLLQEKEKQAMYRRLFRRSYCQDYLDYVCVDQCGKLLRPNYVTEHFAWVIQKYGLKKIRFHDLRHTCASLLLSKGISMKQIQIWLGHSTFSTTADIYAHLDYSAQLESANAMNSIFTKDTETASEGT